MVNDGDTAVFVESGAEQGQVGGVEFGIEVFTVVGVGDTFHGLEFARGDGEGVAGAVSHPRGVQSGMVLKKSQQAR